MLDHIPYTRLASYVTVLYLGPQCSHQVDWYECAGTTETHNAYACF